MFKRSLASVAAVAVVSGAIVAPANAMTLKVDDDVTCTINLNVKEADILHLNHPATKIRKDQIHILKTYTNGLPGVRKEKSNLENKLADHKLATAERERLTSQLKEIKERITTIENFAKALDACEAGKGYSSDQSGESKKPGVPDQSGESKKPGVPDQSGESKKPGVPDQSGESKKPGVPDQSGESKKPGVPDQSGESKKPGVPDQSGESNQPDGKRALPSTNGAIIGVIVAVLGILAAALPVINSILRALLP
ncbi:hypothetical protein CIP107539_02201 [Corynebacterium diphtheriae]|uniref:Uncharacterized protein n=1 Tax=Corynebacterium diphtheriae TaxID=1717 RepID=A0A811G5F5_CORDP|nr:hypothetical protein CIP101841_02081 [Corynebacterium diphtheriae]CAB0616375.1 hypothetical protein CIP107559_02071 [Corynebacterium diphtheriae]CAB0618132.1 hypothetical protein CIP107558_01999 [Corynebacterium diphtheriae]CAB0619630.1 hypothetical protein CIP107539_02201 [Corynebacterium diphtheriae]CAB0619817.1 hypothetical protein CIP107547_02215 [Corynebacterium diphtheriae]